MYICIYIYMHWIGHSLSEPRAAAMKWNYIHTYICIYVYWHPLLPHKYTLYAYTLFDIKCCSYSKAAPPRVACFYDSYSTLLSTGNQVAQEKIISRVFGAIGTQNRNLQYQMVHTQINRRNFLKDFKFSATDESAAGTDVEHRFGTKSLYVRWSACLWHSFLFIPAEDKSAKKNICSYTKSALRSVMMSARNVLATRRWC